MIGMVSGVLRAVSALAKQNPAAGGPDIPLSHETTAIGRNVPRVPGLPIPTDWAQVSGKHCRIVCSAVEGGLSFTVFDTSTNGTFIVSDEGARTVKVPKGGSHAIAPGQTLRLSTLPSNGDVSNVLECACFPSNLSWLLVKSYQLDNGPTPSSGNASNIFEYCLELVADESRVRKADASQAAGREAVPAKRLCMSGAAGGTPEPAGLADSVVLRNLQATTKELQERLSAAKGENEASRKQLKARTAEVQKLNAELAATRQQEADAVAAAKAEAAAQHETKAKALTEAADALAARFEAEQQAARAMQQAKEDIEAELVASQAELAEARKERDEATAALARDRGELQARADAAGLQVVQLQAQLAQASTELEAAQARAEKADSAAERARNEAVTLRQDLSDSQNELHAVREENEHLEMDLRIVRNEVDVGNDRLAKQQQQWAKVHAAQQGRDRAGAVLAEQQRRVEEREQVLAQETRIFGRFVAESAPDECNGAAATNGHSAGGGTALQTATQNTVEVSGPLRPAPTAAAPAQTQAASAPLVNAPSNNGGASGASASGASGGTPPMPRHPATPSAAALDTQRAAPPSAAAAAAASAPAETPAMPESAAFESGQQGGTLGIGAEEMQPNHQPRLDGDDRHGEVVADDGNGEAVGDDELPDADAAAAAAAPAAASPAAAQQLSPVAVEETTTPVAPAPASAKPDASAAAAAEQQAQSETLADEDQDEDGDEDMEVSQGRGEEDADMAEAGGGGGGPQDADGEEDGSDGSGDGSE